MAKGLGLKTMLSRFPPSVRGHVVAAIGELVGTTAFLFFAFAGTQVANISSNNDAGGNVVSTTPDKNPAQLLYISLVFGFSLAVNVWTFVRVSGGLFNPAVTLAMQLVGGFSPLRGIIALIMELLGGILAAALVRGLFPGDLQVETVLRSDVSLVRGVFIELILTSELVFVILMLATEKHEGNFIAPVGIGLALFIAELVGVFWTGGSLNPARSFGPAVVTGNFNSDHWVYWVGPLGGSIFAVALYKLVKALDYDKDSVRDAVGLDGQLVSYPRTPQGTVV